MDCSTRNLKQESKRIVGTLIPEVCDEICNFENLDLDNELRNLNPGSMT